MSAVLAHDFLTEGQAEAAAQLLGALKWLEDRFDITLWKSRASVLNNHLFVRFVGSAQGEIQRFLVATGHGLQAVPDEVDENLAKPFPVSKDIRQLRFAVFADRYPLLFDLWFQEAAC